MRWLYAVFSLLLLCALPGRLAAEIYTWIDEKGLRNYSNVAGDRSFKSRTQKKSLRKQGLKNDNMQRVASRMMQWRPATKVLQRSSSRYDRYIKKAAYRYKVDPLLIKAIIKAESDFNQYAVSSKGAQGLMQLMPMTAKELSVANPFDAKQNINGGTRYFKQILENFNGNVSLSIAAYNAGPTLVSRLGKIPRIPETREYVRRVLYMYNSYRNAPFGLSSIKVQKLVTVN